MQCRLLRARQVGTIPRHIWVNAEAVPRFYPNVVTLSDRPGDIDEQRQTVRILQKSNLPGRWSVKDSFHTLDIARLGFDVLFEANWIRMPQPRAAALTPGLAWERGGQASGDLPAGLFSDANFAMFSASATARWWPAARFYRTETSWACRTSWPMPPTRSLSGVISPRSPPRRFLACRWSATSSDDDLEAARKAGFEIGDPLAYLGQSRD